jgi:glycosyltransferase involved in cell wall biosynthesis
VTLAPHPAQNPAQNPTITVAICTHNRATYLRLALQSLLEQTAPQHRFDILVVDNASTDGTPAEVERARRARGDIRCVREDRLGLSHARNRAIAETRTPYIAYLDDDAIAAPRWVERLVHCFTQLSPAPAAVGGPIHPIWEAARPSWLPDSLLGYLTVLERPGSGYLDLKRQLIFGANMAFDHRALTEVGGFSTSLGRIGNRLLSGEEMLLLAQLHARGACGYYDEQASVRHHVAANRLSKEWFYRRVYWDGMSSALVNIELQRLHGARRVAVALRELRSHVFRGRLWQMLPGIGDPSSRFGARCRTLAALCRTLGYFKAE